MKTFLITVSGMSPAIITETLWALATESPPVVPDEVVVITTLKGEADIHDQLLTPRSEWKNKKVWERLRQDIFTVTKTQKTSRKLQLAVRVIELPDEVSGIKTKAYDLRTKSDNAEAADFILQTLIPFVDAADHHVIASIAGGRKTMGALLYASMSLVGRETDRVTHVLVSDPFDLTRGFYYPPQPVQILQAFDPVTKKTFPVNAKDALIDLADIPFVPLRNGFKELNEKSRSFGGLVDRYTHELKLPLGRKVRVSFDESAHELTVEGKTVELSGRGLLAAMFSYKKLLEGGGCYDNLYAAEVEFTPYVEDLKLRNKNHPAVVKMIVGKADRSNLSQGMSDIRGQLKKKLPEDIVKEFLDKGVGFNADIA